MKKTICILFIISSLSTIGYSQFNKGRYLAGGSFNANRSNMKGTSLYVSDFTTSSISFYPQVGYFFANNFAAGAGLNLSSSVTNGVDLSNNTKYKSTSNTISFEPFVRYYFIKKFYTQASGSFGSSHWKSNSFAGVYDNQSSSKKGWSLSAGYAYMINNHVALEPQIGYGLTYYENSQNFGNLFFKIGIQVYLGK